MPPLLPNDSTVFDRTEPAKAPVPKRFRAVMKLIQIWR